MRCIIQDFKVTPGKSCLYASLYDLMAYYGYMLGESDIFYICDGFHFEYESLESNLKFNAGERLTSDNCEKWAREFSDVLSIEARIGKEIKDERVFQSLIGALANNNPILLLVDSKVLDYHPRHYQLNNIQDSHCIILYGVDDKENHAYIGDSYILDNTGEVILYSGEFPLNRVIESTRGFVWFNIDASKAVDKKKIFDKMAENLERFLTEKREGTLLKGNLALYRCIDDIRMMKEIDTRVFEAVCTEFAYFISAHFLSKFDYLINMLAEDRSFHINHHEVILEDVKSLKSDWSSFCVHLLRAGFSTNKSQIDRIAENGINLVRKQERIFFEVLNQIKAVVDTV